MGTVYCLSEKLLRLSDAPLAKNKCKKNDGQLHELVGDPGTGNGTAGIMTP